MADLEQAREWLSQATRVAVLTGAGISAESGVPTFRGDGGLWKEYKAEDLATPEAFLKDPRLVWEWYNWRRELIAKALPNAAHKALVQLEIKKREYTLVTQNVDGLHDRAGSGRMLKLHGDIWRMRCTACGANWPDRRAPLPKIPPHCACGGLARPGVVWFGEPLPRLSTRRPPWCRMQSRAEPRSSRSTLTTHHSQIWWTAPCAASRANCCRSSRSKSPLSCQRR